MTGKLSSEPGINLDRVETRWFEYTRKWHADMPRSVNYVRESVAPLCEDRARRRQARAYTSSEPALARHNRQTESMGPPHSKDTFHLIGTIEGRRAPGVLRAQSVDSKYVRYGSQIAPVRVLLGHTPKKREPSGVAATNSSRQARHERWRRRVRLRFRLHYYNTIRVTTCVSYAGPIPLPGWT